MIIYITTVRWSQIFDFATSPAFKWEFLKTFRACLLSMKNRISLLQLDRTISEGVIAHFHFIILELMCLEAIYLV
jgi:hypothetical protein